MYDAVAVDCIPAEATMVAGYVNGAWPTIGPLRARFPKATAVTITVNAQGVADVLDVESGDATPAQAPAWAQRMRALGLVPTTYCSASVWPAVVSAFRAMAVPDPLYWVAEYDGVPSVPAGAVAKQYQGGPSAPYDVSAVADFWPGIDPEPAPRQEDATMTVTLGPNGELYIAAASPQSHLLLFSAPSPAGSWSVIDVTDKIATEAPGQPPYLVQP